MELKQSVPGSNVVEVQFDREDRGVEVAARGAARRHRGAVAVGGRVSRADVERIADHDATGGDGRRHWASSLASLSVQNTSLDDVFVHYTGRQLRDEQVKAVSSDAAAAGSTAMNRFLAIVEREMRKFFRSPVLMIMSMMLPIVQLVILGHAYGGNIHGCASGGGGSRWRAASGEGARGVRLGGGEYRARLRPSHYEDETRRARTCAPARWMRR